MHLAVAYVYAQSIAYVCVRVCVRVCVCVCVCLKHCKCVCSKHNRTYTVSQRTWMQWHNEDRELLSSCSSYAGQSSDYCSRSACVCRSKISQLKHCFRNIVKLTLSHTQTLITAGRYRQHHGRNRHYTNGSWNKTCVGLAIIMYIRYLKTKSPNIRSYTVCIYGSGQP